MKEKYYLSRWVKRFLLEYLLNEKNLSYNTQCSYRDMLRVFLPFLAMKVRKNVDQLTIDDMSPRLIKEFLLHVESERHCSARTRNQRLAAIHTLSQFISLNSPEHIEWFRQINAIPFKKAKQSYISYLEKNEMDALLNTPDCTTQQGRRDHALLLLLYNTGARADEVAKMTIADLEINKATKTGLSSVLIKGKGNKSRRCPLWAQTVKELTMLIVNREQIESVFLNRCNKPLTRFGIYRLVKQYSKKLTEKFTNLAKKHVSPHTIRHTTATHLLRAGVDINTIRAWLGHVSINTTNVYAEIDLEMKARALKLCEVTKNGNHRNWIDSQNLMGFLKSL